MLEAGDIGALIAGAIAFALTVLALLLAVSTFATRSLFAGVACCAAMAGLVSAALTATDAPLAGVAMACFGGAILPLLLLGGSLLSTNSAKVRRGTPWFSILAALAAAGLISFVAPEIGVATLAPQNEPAGLPALLAATVFAAGAVVAGLVGIGERGALDPGKMKAERPR